MEQDLNVTGTTDEPAMAKYIGLRKDLALGLLELETYVAGLQRALLQIRDVLQGEVC